MSIKSIALSLCLLGVAASPASADLMVYPAKGQSNDQMEKDKFECQRWATQQTGFDPLATPRASTPPPAEEEKVGGVGKGAVGGALGGALIGAIAGDTKKGAAIGAGSGALIGGMRRRDQNQRQEQARQNWEQREAANYSRQRADFNRAMTTCLQGRGYSVN